jgi:chorismate dehydratase
MSGVSFPDSLEFQPFIYGLQNNLVPHNFKISISSFVGSAEKLRDGVVDLGFIPAIEYARRKEIWNLVPGLCLSARQSLKSLQLFFRKGLKGINSIAVDVHAQSETILLKILMREKYLMNPEYIPMEPDLDQMLARADAALLTGQAAMKNCKTNRNRLDLGEEWYDLTNLPYVIGFWAGRQFTIKPDDVEAIKKSYALGSRNIEKICKNYSQDWAFYHDFLSRDLSYSFSEDVNDGLMEYYNFAFFFGFIEHIPDLHFYR